MGRLREEYESVKEENPALSAEKVRGSVQG
jgi:hypothetical protein